MTVYFVTGNLGSGKSLISVSKIQDKLIQGRPVATNLDLKLFNMPRVGMGAKNTRVYRIPDQPTLNDLEAIGRGNVSYDESLNGLLVLDECAIWLNARTWNDKTRQPILSWFTHARKIGWDIIFIVQNISLIDKQAREALGEHVVYCSRFDRLSIPFVSTIFGFIFGSRMPLPKIHLGVVKYRDVVVERWVYRGSDLYYSYDTKQQFSSFYDKGVYSVIPPYLTHGRYQKPLNIKKIMRLTKIYLKRLSRFRLILLGLIIGITCSYFYFINNKSSLDKVVSTSVISELKIKSFKTIGAKSQINFIKKDGENIDSNNLINQGYKIEVITPCKMKIYKGTENAIVTC